MSTSYTEDNYPPDTSMGLEDDNPVEEQGAGDYLEEPEPNLVDEVEDGAEEVKETEEEPIDDKEVKELLLSIIEDVEKEEQPYRSVQLRLLKKLDLFWHGIQRLYWSETTNDFLTIQDVQDPELLQDLEGLDEVINIYRAHGESIIAALSTGVPVVHFSPADADSPIDILTSKAYSKISDLIQKRNKAQLLFIKALFTLWNQHYVAAYHYSKEDEKFGTFADSKFVDVTSEQDIIECSVCGEELPEYNVPCPTCQSTAGMPSTKEVVDQVEVITPIPKSSQEIEIYGPLNVLIQNKARTVEDTGILILYTENDSAKVYSTFPELIDKINDEPDTDEDSQVRATHNSTFDTNTVTVKQCWLRPWMFWRLGKSKIPVIKYLYSTYPKGVFLTVVQDEVVEIHDESLDSRWTLTHSPVSRTVISDPMGAGLVSIQETINDLYSLSKETVKHGIPETFYDQNIIDAEKYQSVQATPGMLFPVKRQAGQSISDSFFQFKSATLSKEVDSFRSRNDSDAQFVTGAFPSIYGGPNEGSSGTLGEYSLSKNMALQRLQVTYKTLTDWWVTILSKIVPDFVENMLEDEKFSKRQGSTYINVVIKKEEAESGKIGMVEPENSEQIPISWAQKKDLLIQMLQLNNETLNAAMFHPENATTFATVIGFTDFFVPGEEDRTKQLIEIGQLLRSQPSNPMMEQGAAQPNPMMSPPTPTPSVMPELDVDVHPLHIEVVRSWAKSTAGMEAKANNPNGYMNVLLHLKIHKEMDQSLTAPPPPNMPQENPNQPGNPNSSRAGQQGTPPKTMKTPENTPEPRPVQ